MSDIRGTLQIQIVRANYIIFKVFIKNFKIFIFFSSGPIYISAMVPLISLSKQWENISYKKRG